MPNIDIPVSVELEVMFELPNCDDIKLPSPSPMKITLPTGSVMKAIADISKGIPTDCSASFSLLVQLAPLLGSMECLLKILKLLKPLIDVIKGLPFPPVKAINDFIEAAVDLKDCLLIPTPANLLPFIHDILCLILKMLKCVLGGLKTITEIMGGLGIQLKIAEGAGNSELLKALQCAQENAATSAQHLTQSMEPLVAILDLVGPIMGLAGLDPITLPAIGSQTDVESLKKAVDALQGVVDSIETIVDALPGGACP
jgi:hypothetical protein